MNTILSDYNKSGYKPSIVSSTIYKDVSSSFINPISGDVLASTDIDSVKNSIRNIVLTPIGTRAFFPDFGSRVGDLLFELADITTQVAIETEISESILNFEPRVSELKVDVKDQSEQNAYFVTLTFSMNYVAGTIEFILNRIR